MKTIFLTSAIWLLATIATCLMASVAESQELRHVPQLVIPCEVVEVYDGDTVTVRLTIDVRVRLLDCWAPEVRTTDDVEKAYGIYSRETLCNLIGGRKCLLTVPLNGADRLDDVFTFGRLLGRLRDIESGLDASEEMHRMGAAMRGRP